MDNNKLETISNLFEDSEIRSVWDSEKDTLDTKGIKTNRVNTKAKS